jgi:hypothetical protein
VLPSPDAIAERSGIDPRSLPETVLAAREPVVLRGLVSHWPLVEAARSADTAIDYLKRFDHGGMPVTATVAAPREGGRLL